MSSADLPAPSFQWITTDAELAAAAGAVAAAPWIALDTEGNSMHVYRERVCLVQINAGGRIYLIDPLALAPEIGAEPSRVLDPLRAALEDPGVPLYLHGGEYDVSTLRRDFGVSLRGIFDTQQAAQYLGAAQTSYGAVVADLLGIHLAKGHTHYDWGTRPIAGEAVRYAVDDVVHLPAVAEVLRQRIAAADLAEELALANAAIEQAQWRGGFDPAGVWKVTGARDLSPGSMSLAVALWHWRDARARERNLPPGRLINNELLLALARQAPTNYQLLKKIGVRGRILSELGEALIDCIRAGLAEPPPVPPRPRARDVGRDEEDRERRLKDWRRSESEQRKATLQVVLPAKALEYLKQHGASDLDAVPQLGAKRIARYGDALRRLCR